MQQVLHETAFSVATLDTFPAILCNVIKQETQANKTVMALRLTTISLLLEDEEVGMEEFTTIGKPWVSN